MLSLLSSIGLLALSLTPAQAQLVTSYAPVNTTCPETLIRSAATISSEESTYLSSRAPQVQSALRSFLEKVNVAGLDVSSMFSSNTTVPRLAFAASGGGLRAMTYGGSIFNALDSRTVNGTLGGVLQSCQYMAGLSGGSWLIGSVAINDFATIPQLIQNNWDIDDVFSAPQGGVINTVEYYTDLVEQVQDKNNEGFFTTITDYWGRVIGYHTLNSTNGDVAIQWSDIANTTSFTSFSMPFPLVVTDGRAPGQTVTTAMATIYEVNPYEFGSWDEQVYSFTPTRYLGSDLMNGEPVDGSTCVTGYDNVAFIMGTSSSLFSAALTEISGTDTSILTDVLADILEKVAAEDNDIAYYPNPFRGLENVSLNISNSGNLTLVDGGLDNQNIPIWPLIQPEREIDVIFAADASADTDYNWPNGSSLVQTYQRVTGAGGIMRSNKSISFPYIPTTETFVNLGLNQNVTFFGCNATNGTLAGTAPPIIVYIPNTPYSYYTNFSTYDGEYSSANIDGMLNNGLDIMTSGNSTSMAVCIACAIVQRGLERGNISTPAACTQCFSEMCWNGTIDNTTPSESLLTPALRVAQVISGTGAASSTSAAATSFSSFTAKSAAVSTTSSGFTIGLSSFVVAILAGAMII